MVSAMSTHHNTGEQKEIKTALAWMETEGKNWKDENNRHIQVIKVTQH